MDLLLMIAATIITILLRGGLSLKQASISSSKDRICYNLYTRHKIMCIPFFLPLFAKGFSSSFTGSLTKNTYMRNSFVFLISIIAFLFVNAQTERGNWMVGTYIGSGGYSHVHSKSTHSTSSNVGNNKYNSFSIGIAPFGLYFVEDNLAIGASAGISFNTGNSESTNTGYPYISKSTDHSMTFSLGPQLRRFFGTVGQKDNPGLKYSQE